ncbi:MAG: YibL family ribosome-associated protein [Vibrionaceae bacterium]
MNNSKELQAVNNQLDRLEKKLAAAIAREDNYIIEQTKTEQAKLQKQRQQLKFAREKKASQEAQQLRALPFNRALTKQEQADLGKLKKTVKGLVVVHHLTALGKQLELETVTGFSRKPF